MKEFVFLLVAVLLWAVAWRVVAKFFRNKGNGGFASHAAGAAAGALLAIIALVVVLPDQEAAAPVIAKEVDREPTVTSSAPTSSGVKQASEEYSASKEVRPLSLPEARDFANLTLRVINEAEQALNDGLKLGDTTGISKYVIQPLNQELGRWPNLPERHANDQRQIFAYCQDAAVQLLSLAHTASRQQTVETMKYLRKAEEDYRKQKDQCMAQLAKKDGQIMAEVAADDAELVRKFGGRDCLTVLDVDSKTGQVVEKPKPAHCKKR